MQVDQGRDNNPPENFAMRDGAVEGEEEFNPFKQNNPDEDKPVKVKRKLAYSLKIEDLSEPGAGLD